MKKFFVSLLQFKRARITGYAICKCLAEKEVRPVIFYTCVVIFCCFCQGFTVFKPNPSQAETISISFNHKVGDKALQLFDETYINTFGETFVVSKFRYYVAHLAIVDLNDKKIPVQADKYYLVNEADSNSKKITLPYIKAVKALSFTIGVDSVKNVGGVQTGSLDPLNGMFWTWNSGYVFAKLEGTSDASMAPAHQFSWDVGGFKQRENATREIILAVNKQMDALNHTIVVNVDLLKWFNASHAIKIADSPVCHQPGALAMQLADNYSTMFSIAP